MRAGRSRPPWWASGNRPTHDRPAALLALLLLLTLPCQAATAQTRVPGDWPAPEAPEDVGADGAVLWDPADDRVLWGQDARTPRPMASTTKIMTTLLAVEAGTLDDTVTVSDRAAALGRVPGGATLGLTQGQRLPMRDLLAGLMLRSGNDAAVAVAEHVAGSEARFVDRMNRRAEELGLDDTNFLNASGLTDDPAHHASPLDLARLAEVALAEPPIAAWAAAATLENETFGTIVNRNELLGAYPGADGVKTGYTLVAGRCLVASADRDGRRLISVVLGSVDHFADSTAILDHGFEDWARYVVDPADGRVTYRTSAGVTTAAPAASLGVTIPSDAPVAAQVRWEPRAIAAVDAGARLGMLRLLVDGVPVASSPVRAGEQVTGPSNAVTDIVGAGLQDALRTLVRLEGQPVSTGSALPAAH